MTSTKILPIITVDGPSGAGKGTLCQRLAQYLDWTLLDSGALYRIVAWAAQQRSIALDNAAQLAALAVSLTVEFQVKNLQEPTLVLLDGNDISRQIRTEDCGVAASAIAVYPAVRDALKQLQRHFVDLASSGLVADGRDMGTVIFPDAALKIYLDASVQARTQRRYQQLIHQGEHVIFNNVLHDVTLRDERDTNRTLAPLKPATDAMIIDSSDMTIDDVFDYVVQACKKAQ